MPIAETELKGLMLAGLKGDAAAYRHLLHRVSKYLRDYYKSRLARIGRSSSEAEDLVQEALLAIHSRRHTYDPTEPFGPWLYAIARYKLIDHLRHTKRSRTDVPIDEAEDILAQDDHIDVESSHDLNRLLSRLPGKMRQAIQCVKLDGMSVAEAAGRCGMSESAVKVNVHRGLKALSAAIARDNTK